MKTAGQETKVRKHDQELNYQNMFWLCMIASIIGLIMEGVWTVFKFGRWESHVNTIWGPFCLLYGAAAIVFYVGSIKFKDKHIIIQFLLFALIADIVEYTAGWMLEAGLSMKAWTYKHHFMNFQTRISLQMTIIWGIAGIAFMYLLMPAIRKCLNKMQGNRWRVACIALSIFMCVNVAATVMCLVRWSQRHKGMEATNSIERLIDSKYDDARMHSLFCEWWFIDEGKEFWEEYKK